MSVYLAGIVDAARNAVDAKSRDTSAATLLINVASFPVDVESGEAGEAVLNLSPGRYRVICNVPGHREAGMTEFIEVKCAYPTPRRTTLYRLARIPGDCQTMGVNPAPACASKTGEHGDHQAVPIP
ncbi:MAG: hypothetical protein M3464_05610 [Chloroflexota bacterium]|nr:hypothetical protein [Chloroflexota bacterium]